MRNVLNELEHFVVGRICLEEAERKIFVHHVLVFVLQHVIVLAVSDYLHEVVLFTPIFEVTDFIEGKVCRTSEIRFEIWTEFINV